ncbi:type II toxin-antitoxin system RelE/ParE family toxin [Flavobacterium sp.]|uniref:type II toxin-antitoxin system RelE/ParE family toxin n=1 Tax=Flavobacterium sp. TaxID=239 RepID=UPI00286E3162|nr:type II toxin-antitoxin system RelE/ParE family toxin [Flavobacterium sp.]
MKPVIWSTDSIKSIQDIYDYISFESPQNADLVIDTLFDIGDKLNILPEKNPVEPLFNSNLIRFFPKWNYKIIYRIEAERIYILDVFSTKQNPKKFRI